MRDEHLIEQERAEEAQQAIREGIERARELVCEAKSVIGQQAETEPAAEAPVLAAPQSYQSPGPALR